PFRSPPAVTDLRALLRTRGRRPLPAGQRPRPEAALLPVRGRASRRVHLGTGGPGTGEVERAHRPDRAVRVTTASPDQTGGEQLSAVVSTLIKALRALGQAGQPDRALELAATAWSQLRREDPRQAERINGCMHFLARLPQSQPVPATGPAAPATRGDRAEAASCPDSPS